MDSSKFSNFYEINQISYGANVPADLLEGIWHPDLLSYLKYFLPERSPFVSSIYLISADGIQACEEPHLYEYALFKNGYVPVAQSMAADLLAVDKVSGQAFWFKLDYFVSDIGTIIGLDNVEQEVTCESLKAIGIYVSEFSETFISRIFDGSYTRLFSLLGE